MVSAPGRVGNPAVPGAETGGPGRSGAAGPDSTGTGTGPGDGGRRRRGNGRGLGRRRSRCWRGSRCRSRTGRRTGRCTGLGAGEGLFQSRQAAGQKGNLSLEGDDGGAQLVGVGQPVRESGWSETVGLSASGTGSAIGATGWAAPQWRQKLAVSAISPPQFPQITPRHLPGCRDSV